MEEKAIKIKRILTVLMFVIMLFAIAVALFGYGKGYFQSEKTLKDYLNSFGYAAPLMLIVIQAMQVLIPILPGWLGYIVGARLFGVIGGFWCNYVGISLGSIMAYYLARTFGVAIVDRLVSIKRHQRFIDWIQTKKSYTVIFALSILLPFAPDDFLCFFSGLMKMSAKTFVWIIVLAKPWCILAYCLFFANVI